MYNNKVEELIQKMTLEEKAQMCSGRDFWKTQDIPRLDIPSVMMCDGPNGLRKQLGEGDHLGINASIETVCYPTASAIASSFDRNLIRSLGHELGKECNSENVGMLLGPGVNIKRSPLCGRNFEYFSEDPYVSGEMAAAYIEGLQSEGVASCVKHFAANNQETKRLSGSSEIDERTFHEIYLPAFEKAVQKGNAESVMCAYNALNGVFCAENKDLLTDILRKDLGFNGMVVTDWGAVKDRVKGLDAGVDLEMPGSTEGKTKKIVDAVNNETLNEEILDQAVRNVLTFVLNHAENKNGSYSESFLFDRHAAREKSMQFARECAVLLKNEDNLLPLSKGKKVAFIGAFAESPRYQGAGSSHINVKHVVSALESVELNSVEYAKGYDPESEVTDEALLNEAVKTASECDIAVIFSGLPESYETEGVDRYSLAIPENQNELIKKVVEVQENVVVVLHGGSVMDLPWEPLVSSILLVHLGGDGVGRATVDLLYGKVNPSGKLAESWPLKLEDNPSYLNFPGENGIVNYQEGIFVGYRYYEKKKMDVRYPFGHGLSYTNFIYTDLKISQTNTDGDNAVTVTCNVKNDGSYDGSEVVQLYIGIKNSKVRRAVKELKGFEKVFLKSGESCSVSFTLNNRDFSYYETSIHDWYVEEGEYVISVGSSSDDIRLTDTIQMNASRTLPVNYTRFSTFEDLLQSEKGRAFFSKFLEARGHGQPKEESEDQKAMGSGAAKMQERMMMEMTLNGLYSYGIMSDEQLDAFIDDLNRQ